MENIICLVFINKNCKKKIITFTTRKVAKEYYRIALQKSNFCFAGILKECIQWCKNHKNNFTIIERDSYNIYE